MSTLPKWSLCFCHLPYLSIYLSNLYKPFDLLALKLTLSNLPVITLCTHILLYLTLTLTLTFHFLMSDSTSNHTLTNIPVLAVERTPARNIQVFNPTPNTLNVRWEAATGPVQQYRVVYAPLTGARPSESVSFLPLCRKKSYIVHTQTLRVMKEKN